MVRVDDKTIETHFALGSLFRRRGEVDRAIRIHQNIIARPDLAAEQRDQALFSLAKDYLRAGLLDRAENLFVRLSQGSRYQVEAFEQLCRIYEQEREWQRAIESAEKLEVLSGQSLALQTAHYYCELAEQSVTSKDFTAARAFVKKAQSGRPRTQRGALTRAKIARDTSDNKTALRLYNRIVDENSYLMTEALPALVDIHEHEGTLGQLDKSLRSHLETHPAMKTNVAYTAIVNNIGGIDIIDECVEEYMLSEPTLTDFIDLQAVNSANGEDRQIALDKVRAALSKLSSSIPRYQCKECGFSSQALLWQCPSCRDWETQRPFSTVSFDSLLQRSSGM
jgi:lipopolysaccharide biosynthesis regulator YciM